MVRAVSRVRVVPASPAAVFDVLADPRRHPELDGSGTVRATVTGPSRLSAGARFGVRMKLLVPYVVRNTVVEFDEGRRIAWRHVGGHVWRYELEGVNGGTRVTETFDWSAARSPRVLERLGFPERNAAGMEATLQRLAELVTARPGA
jgi:uncharacterized protein YndB with AHSA1/START domain